MADEHFRTLGRLSVGRLAVLSSDMAAAMALLSMRTAAFNASTFSCAYLTPLVMTMPSTTVLLKILLYSESRFSLKAVTLCH